MIAIGKDANGKDIMARNMKPAQYQGVDFEIKTPEVKGSYLTGTRTLVGSFITKPIPFAQFLESAGWQMIGLWIPSFNP